MTAISRVLQVGPLKQSLTDTLASTYDALLLPTDQPERDAFLSEHGTAVTVAVTSGVLLTAMPRAAAASMSVVS